MELGYVLTWNKNEYTLYTILANNKYVKNPRKNTKRTLI